ncbi:hypothetical protein RD792_013940, partial [Penstemon davidsonii]
MASLNSFRNHTLVSSFNPCSYAFFGDTTEFEFRGASDLSDPNFVERVRASVPVVLDWAIGNLTCVEVQSLEDYACKSQSYCVDSNTGLGGYRCRCNDGYEGNPYLDPGCTDIDECADPSTNNCITCVNTLGSFNCTCPQGYRCRCNNSYEDDPHIGPGCIDIDECADPNASDCLHTCINTLGSFNCSCPRGYFGNGREGGKGVGFGFLALIILVTLLFFSHNKRNIIKLREKFFQQNGGLLLKQQISSSETPMDSTKIFTTEELENATDNYAKESAGALSYLHSAASKPVIHRDVKSANILLDQNYTAKIADFGASRLISLDQTEVTTMVQGTLGYLDPKYSHSSQLTEKSDVYSFGVVLAELMTGKKPIDMERNQEERNLTTYFKIWAAVESMDEDPLVWFTKLRKELFGRELELAFVIAWWLWEGYIGVGVVDAVVMREGVGEGKENNDVGGMRIGEGAL